MLLRVFNFENAIVAELAKILAAKKRRRWRARVDTRVSDSAAEPPAARRMVKSTARGEGGAALTPEVASKT